MTYTYSEDRCIYMGSPGFEGTVRIRDRTASIIVKVSFNIAAYDATKCSDKVIHLSWRSAPNSVCDTDSIDTNFVDSAVD